MCHIFALLLKIVVLRGKMPRRSRMKNANKPAPYNFQSEGHVASKASESKVQLNVTSAQHSPRTIRSHVMQFTLYKIDNKLKRTKQKMEIMTVMYTK